MNGFAAACKVEAQAMSLLLPYLEERADDGRLVICNKGPLAKFLQETAGDVIINLNERIYSVEIKAEEKHTGNFFLETWSNKNLNDRNSHAERGSNPGWLSKLRSDLLMYYFLDKDILYIVDMFSLQQWAFGGGGSPASIYKFNEVPQGKYSQANDTWGRIVPIRTIYEEVGLKWCYLRQLELVEAGQTA
jgi:hypothetical protein